MTSQHPEPTFDSEPEISIYDIVQFLKRNLRVIGLGLVGGIVLGGAGGAFLSKERATVTLDNQFTGTSISYTDWITLSGTLPYLASSVFEAKKAAGEEVRDQLFLTQKPWWDKNVKPVLALDKNSSKELGTVPDAMKEDYGRILRITFQSEAKNEALAYRQADEAVAFMRSAAIFLRLQSILEAYRVQSIQTDQTTSALFTQNTIDQTYLNKDRSALNELIAFNTREINVRIAAMNKVINESSAIGNEGRNVFNIRGGETGEIPLDAKLNEIKLALHGKEIDRLKAEDQRTQNQVLKDFLDQAEPLFKSHTLLSATAFLDRLLVLEKDLRSHTAGSDLVRIAKLDAIRGDLLAVQLTFINQLSVVSRSVEPVHRTAFGILGGGFGGAILALIAAWLVGLYQASEPKDSSST